MDRRRIRWSGWLTAACGLTVCLAPGCSSVPEAGGSDQAAVRSDFYGTMPPDFTLDLTLDVGRTIQRAKRPGDGRPRPTRIVVTPEGSLYWGSDPRRGYDWMPPFRRRLDRPTLARLWERCRELGLDQSDPELAWSTIHVEDVPPEGVRFVVVLEAGGDRRLHVREVTAADADRPAEAALLDQLNALAWAADRPEGERIARPRRRDFGPDPYAPYRREADTDDQEVGE